MSDGGRDHASLGVEGWKLSQKWSVQRSAVRSIAWLGVSVCTQDNSGNNAHPGEKNINRTEEADANPMSLLVEAPKLSPSVKSLWKRASGDDDEWREDEPTQSVSDKPKTVRESKRNSHENGSPEAAIATIPEILSMRE